MPSSSLYELAGNTSASIAVADDRAAYRFLEFLATQLPNLNTSRDYVRARISA
jgi:hypothetical protein